jgi:hypothetical protein
LEGEVIPNDDQSDLGVADEPINSNMWVDAKIDEFVSIRAATPKIMNATDLNGDQVANKSRFNSVSMAAGSNDETMNLDNLDIKEIRDER